MALTECFFFFIILCRPVNIVCWKRAICLEFMEKVRLFILFSIRKIEHLENEGSRATTFWCHKLPQILFSEVF